MKILHHNGVEMVLKDREIAWQSMISLNHGSNVIRQNKLKIFGIYRLFIKRQFQVPIIAGIYFFFRDGFYML